LNVPPRRLMLIVCGGLILAGAQARAGDAVGRTTSPKRQTLAQMSGCMTKRMTADKTISYYGAMKACQDAINKLNANPALANLVTPTAATPAL
jgi:hypothetical protein